MQGGVWSLVRGMSAVKTVAVGHVLYRNDLGTVPWVIRTDNKVHRREPTGPATNPFNWETMPGTLIDIAVGLDGSVWGIGTGANGSGGNSVYLWTGQFSGGGAPAAKNWKKVNNGAGTAITVDHEGLAWVVNNNFDIFRRLRE